MRDHSSEAEALQKAEVRLAKVGLMALIDDACGYTTERPKDALRMELARLELNDLTKEDRR